MSFLYILSFWCKFHVGPIKYWEIWMKNEDMTSTRHGWGEGFYCIYEREHSQSHLEVSRLNTAMRDIGWRLRQGEKERKGIGAGEGTRSQEDKKVHGNQEPREHEWQKWLDCIGENRSCGKGSKVQGLDRFRIRIGVC